MRAQLYESKPGVAVVIVLACSAFAIIQPAKEMPRPFDGVSKARTEFVRDVSDGSRLISDASLFC